jgi:N6-adenosine-specific RNA methylase IME4
MQAKHSIETYIDDILGEPNPNWDLCSSSYLSILDFTQEPIETQIAVFTATKPKDKWKFLFNICQCTIEDQFRLEFWQAISNWLKSDKTFLNPEFQSAISNFDFQKNLDAIFLIVDIQILRNAIFNNADLITYIKTYIQTKQLNAGVGFRLLNSDFKDFLINKKFDGIFIVHEHPDITNKLLAFHNNHFEKRDHFYHAMEDEKIHHFFPHLNPKSLAFYYDLPEELYIHFGKKYQTSSQACKAHFRKVISEVLPTFNAGNLDIEANDIKYLVKLHPDQDLIERLLQEFLSTKQYAHFFEFIYHTQPENFLFQIRNVLLELIADRETTDTDQAWIDQVLPSLFFSKTNPIFQEFLKGFFYQTCCELGALYYEKALFHYQKTIDLTQQTNEQASQAAKLPVPSLEVVLAEEAAFFIGEKIYLGFFKPEIETQSQKLSLVMDYASLNPSSRTIPFPVLQSRACLAYKFLKNNNNSFAKKLLDNINRIINGFNDNEPDSSLKDAGKKLLALHQNLEIKKSPASKNHSGVFFTKQTTIEHLPLDPEWERAAEPASKIKM